MGVTQYAEVARKISANFQLEASRFTRRSENLGSSYTNVAFRMCRRSEENVPPISLDWQLLRSYLRLLGISRPAPALPVLLPMDRSLMQCDQVWLALMSRPLLKRFVIARTKPL